MPDQKHNQSSNIWYPEVGVFTQVAKQLRKDMTQCTKYTTFNLDSNQSNLFYLQRYVPIPDSIVYSNRFKCPACYSYLALYLLSLYCRIDVTFISLYCRCYLHLFIILTEMQSQHLYHKVYCIMNKLATTTKKTKKLNKSLVMIYFTFSNTEKGTLQIKHSN